MEVPAAPNVQAHLGGIVTALDELVRLSVRGAAPAPMPSQFLGTIVDNTAALLMTPANALDGGGRFAIFSEWANWVSLMQAVHRSFFSSVLIAVEAGLADICRRRGLMVESDARRRAHRLAERIGEKVERRLIASELQALRRLGSDHPAFSDYLEQVLRSCDVARDRRQIWRRFFRALSIVRNKVSHSQSSLTARERDELIAGGCAVMVDANGDLQINPRMYAQVASRCFDFWDEILRVPGTG